MNTHKGPQKGLVLAVHNCNPSIYETEAGGSQSLRLVWAA